MKLHVWISSTRPGRACLPIAQWFFGIAQQHGTLDVRLVDLAEVNLPFLDEPEHPRFARYTKDHTRAWSALCSEADAFVFVAPEYNHGICAPWKNAIDFLHKEWLYKPCGFVSYGGPAGGARQVQIAKQIVASVKMMPMYEQVIIPLFGQYLKDGVFAPPEVQTKAANTMLDELARWGDALRPLRG